MEVDPGMSALSSRTRSAQRWPEEARMTTCGEPFCFGAVVGSGVGRANRRSDKDGAAPAEEDGGDGRRVVSDKINAKERQSSSRVILKIMFRLRDCCDMLTWQLAVLPLERGQVLERQPLVGAQVVKELRRRRQQLWGDGGGRRL